MLREVDEFLSGLAEAAWELRRVADELAKRGGEWRVRGARLSSSSWMLTKVAAEYRLFAIYSAFLTRKRAAETLERIHARNARRFYATSVGQMGAFLKIGQLLSARPDVLPAVWVRELSRLQDDAPAEPWERVRAVLEAELGPLSRCFQEIDETPVAAASIGQVHRAVTLDGREVAVKVQRPDVAEQVEHDLGLLGAFVEAMRSTLPPSDYDTIVREVSELVRGELDYRAEAQAMARVANLLDGMEGVIVPRPVAELCSARVLVTPFVRARKITTALDEGGAELATRVLGTLLEAYLKQILDGGLFQADPHPGNFLVTEAGELVLLDFGCTRALDETMRRGYLELVGAFVGGDGARLASTLEGLGFRTQSGKPDTLLAFAAALLDGFRRGALSGTLSWPTREELYAQAAGLLETARRDPVTRLPAEFVMIGRVFGTLGGLFQHYRPRIDYARVMPYLFRPNIAA
jgi:ubiquinone biosynthesis protein